MCHTAECSGNQSELEPAPGAMPKCPSDQERPKIRAGLGDLQAFGCGDFDSVIAPEGCAEGVWIALGVSPVLMATKDKRALLRVGGRD